MYPIAALHRPRSLEEALSLAAEGAVPLAGGTDVLVKLRSARMREASPRKSVALVSLSGLSELSGIRQEADGGLSLGALVTFALLSGDALIARRAPILRDAALVMAGPQIRNVATIGGNICNGAASADISAPLLALDASLELRSAGARSRRLPLRAFFLGPGKTARASGELLTRIYLPAEALSRGEGGAAREEGARKTGAAYQKLSTRAAMDIATLGVAARLSLVSGVIERAAIALGAAAPTPLRCAQAESLLTAEMPSPALFAQAGLAAAREASPRSSFRAAREYRLSLIEGVVPRVLNAALSRAQERALAEDNAAAREGAG